MLKVGVMLFLGNDNYYQRIEIMITLYAFAALETLTMSEVFTEIKNGQEVLFVLTKGEIASNHEGYLAGNEEYVREGREQDASEYLSALSEFFPAMRPARYASTDTDFYVSCSGFKFNVKIGVLRVHDKAVVFYATTL